MTICIDMGATEIKVAPIRGKENEIIVGRVERFPTNASLGKEGLVSALHAAIASLVGDGADSIAIASAGDIDVNTSVITYATENLPGMIGFDFGAFSFDRARESGENRRALGGAWEPHGGGFKQGRFHGAASFACRNQEVSYLTSSTGDSLCFDGDFQGGFEDVTCLRSSLGGKREGVRIFGCVPQIFRFSHHHAESGFARYARGKTADGMGREGIRSLCALLAENRLL